SLTPRVLLAVASLALAAQGHAQAQAATAPVRASKEMVVTANRYASEAGLKILREGGNAVDAAIAVQLVLSLVEPQSSGVGGGAFMLLYDEPSGGKAAHGAYRRPEDSRRAATRRRSSRTKDARPRPQRRPRTCSSATTAAPRRSRRWESAASRLACRA